MRDPRSVSFSASSCLSRRIGIKQGRFFTFQGFAHVYGIGSQHQIARGKPNQKAALTRTVPRQLEESQAPVAEQVAMSLS